VPKRNFKIYHVKKHLSLIISFLIALQAWSQTTFEPQILILSPGEIHADKAFENEIEQWRKNNIGKASGPNSDQRSKQPDNLLTDQLLKRRFMQ